MGWVDFDLDVGAQPILPNSHLPKQNWTDSGPTKMKVKSTQPMSLTTIPPCKYGAETGLSLVN